MWEEFEDIGTRTSMTVLELLLELLLEICQKFFVLYIFILHSSSLFFSVFNDSIQWTLDFGLDSVILAVKDLILETTIISQDFLRPVWKLLLS